MQILFLIPSFFIFLYSLYSLTKDDYVCIRKNIAVESIFDAFFILVLLCIIGGAILGFSLPIVFVIGLISLYLILKYNKFPVGRVFDFFTLSFLSCMPVAFLIKALFSKDINLWINIGNGLFYFSLAIIFFKYLYPRIMNTSLREGKITVYFLMFFSLITFVSHLAENWTVKINFLNTTNIILACIFSLSIFLIFRQNKK